VIIFGGRAGIISSIIYFLHVVWIEHQIGVCIDDVELIPA
jgi:hypothetical protein